MNDQTRSKAEFRAMRESLGLSQADVAKLLGIDKENVKRWERPGEAFPKPFAWELLDDLMQRQRETVRQGVAAIIVAQKEMGEPDSVQLTYWRDQAQFDALGRDKGLYGMANANGRIIARELAKAGITVEWAYPDDEDNIYHGAKRME